MQKKLIALAVAAALPALFATSSVWAADTITEALTGGKANADVNYRYEDVTTGAATANKGTAYTIRTRLGYTTDTFAGFGAMVEMESVKSLNRKLSKGYNSTTNGNTTRAAVFDPEGTEVNQAFLSYSGLADTTVKWGRQRLILDNARFVGNVGWRQNEQTYDGLTVVTKAVPSTTITVGYITNVNRIFGDESKPPVNNNAGQAGNHKSKHVLLNANYAGLGFGTITGYYYKLDYDKNSGVTGNSSNTVGARLNGSAPMGGNKLLYTAEYASQKGANTNPVTYSAKYMFVEGGMDLTGIATFKLGYEVLGGDTVNNRAFQTPLATLHAFNGWADKFATGTPNGSGLKDTYLSAGGKAGPVNLLGVYHTFKADKANGGANNYGKELDLLAAYPIDKNYTVGLKYAKFTADAAIGAAQDAKKTWLWGNFKF